MDVRVDGRTLVRADVVAVARAGRRASLDGAARERMERSRASVEALLLAPDGPHVGVTHHDTGGRQHREISKPDGHGKRSGSRDPGAAYGVNTGLGRLATVRIPIEKVEELQENLLLSHACGVGDPLPDDVVRAMLLLRANALAVGLSGVRPDVVEGTLALLNHHITPVVPSRGSLGASGDLVPLAHASLVLIGRGEARVGGRATKTAPLAPARARAPEAVELFPPMAGRDALATAGLSPLKLHAKEGLALVNGTQLMQALLALALEDAWAALRTCEIAGAMSAEALLGSEKPFEARVQAARPHAGQVASAENLRRYVAKSEIVESHRDCDRVQDAYALRCMPQVFGAARTSLMHVEEILATEMNSATDNPLVFEDGAVVSAGNFHGEPLALAGLYMAAAVAEVGSMSERRVARLVDPALSGLPAFLTDNPGLQSGLMIPQYVAAGLVMENRSLASPAATDSIPTSANQEDHVSNGAVQCLNLASIVRNVETIVGIELITAAQALDFRAPLKPGEGSRVALGAVREAIPHLGADRPLAADMERARELVHEATVVEAVSKAIGRVR